MNAYDMFSADKAKEADGIWLDFGTFRIKVARAGGSNVKFAKIVEEKTRPYRRAIEQNLMQPAAAERVMAECFAESVVLNWQVQVEDQWVDGMHSPEGEIVPYSKAAVVQTFIDLPELFGAVQTEAGKLANFRKTAVETEAKN